MASFAQSLTKEQIDAIRAYIIFRANQDKAMEAETAKSERVAAR